MRLKKKSPGKNYFYTYNISETVSPLLEPEHKFVIVSMNRMQQKWHCVISEDGIHTHTHTYKCSVGTYICVVYIYMYIVFIYVKRRGERGMQIIRQLE